MVKLIILSLVLIELLQMAKAYTIDLWKYKKKILSDSEQLVQEVTWNVYNDVIKFSPIDTWEYVSWHKYKWVTRTWNIVKWVVENIWDHTEKVETWFKKTPVNWNLKKMWATYYSVWASPYKRAVEKNEDYFFKKLKWQ
jgi:hypothetical protein